MKRFTIVLVILVLASGAAAAQTEPQAQSKPQAESEPQKMRFEVGAGMGFPTVLTGPDLTNTSNWAARIGIYPSEHFMLTLAYFSSDNDLAPNDVLNSYFAEIYRQSVASNINFNDAQLIDSTCSISQYELGLVKGIPIGSSKKWEAYAGLGIGFQDATGVIQWEGATRRITKGPNAGQIVPVDTVVLPSQYSTDDGIFFVSVRGGVNWVPVNWFALQADLRMVPIDSIYEQSLNTLSVSLNVVFRFGKM